MGYELPEVIKLSGQMQAEITEKIIADVIVGARCSSIIKQGMCNLDQRKEEVVGSRITEITGKGKWIFWRLSGGLFLIFGEMLGRFMCGSEQSDLDPNYHFAIIFQDGKALGFYSTLYAFAMIVDEQQLLAHRYAGHLGVSPLDEQFTPAFFDDFVTRFGKKPVKALLNVQDELCGLGNVYINDILYQAGLHPQKKAAALSAEERDLLYKSIRQVITQALALGGSNEEVDLYGNPGGYERLVSKKTEGKPCGRCGTPIVKSNVLGSASYFCPQCQRE